MNLPPTIKKIFLDGVKSLLDPENNFRSLALAEEKYTSAGYKVFNPFLSNMALEINAEQEIQKKEFTGHQIFILSRCDAYLLLPGWERSNDIRIKLAFCVSQGIPIYEAYTHNYILAEVDLSLTVEYYQNTDPKQIRKLNMN